MTNNDLIDQLLSDSDYLVRPNGTIWKFWPSTRRGRHGERWKCVGSPHSGGYFVLSYKCVLLYTHRIVYRHFHGPLIDGLEVQHIDNDPSNTHPENLEQVDHSTNQKNSFSKVLTQLQVAEIRAQSGRSILGLAKEYGVSRDAIRRCFR